MNVTTSDFAGVLARKLEGKGSKCPVCGGVRFTVGERLVELPASETRIIPLITATCGECGFTMFFNAVVLGVVAS